MRITPARYVSLIAAGVFSFLIFTTVHADEIKYQQPIKTTEVTTGGFSATWKLPLLTTNFFLTQTTVNMAVSANAPSATLTITCRTASNYTGTCAEMPNAIVSAPTNVTLASGIADRTFSFATTSQLMTIRGDRYYLVTVSGNNGNNIGLYGTSTPLDCTSGCVGSPYLYIYGTDSQPTNQFDTSSRITYRLTPANGTTTPSTTVSFIWGWFNSGLELYNVAQTEITDVTAGFQYVPQQSSAALSGFGTTTQTYSLTAGHLHLWRGCLVNTSTSQKVCSGYYSLNVVSPSASSSVPVLPDVNDGNASTTANSSIFAFLDVPQLLQEKFPFSWFFQIAGLLNTLQSTSTAAVSPVVFDYASLDISTTSKNALPATWEAFSTTTITQWIPPAVLSAWRLLMSAVLWFGFAMYVYHSARRQFGGSTNAV